MLAQPSIRADELLRRIGTPRAPLIADVRIAEDVSALPRSIPTAVAVDYRRIESLKDETRPIVTVCHKGLKIGQGAAARLRAFGCEAVYLEGGFTGWHDAHLPTCRIAAGHGTWVLPATPTPKELAGTWVIRRFIDQSADILRVDRNETAAVAERFGGTPVASDPHTYLQKTDLVFPRLSTALKQAETLPDALFDGFLRIARTEATYLHHTFSAFDALFAGTET